MPNLFVAQKNQICNMLQNQFYCRNIQIQVENISCGAFKSSGSDMSHVPYLEFWGRKMVIKNKFICCSRET